jgi:hypothetical protein
MALFNFWHHPLTMLSYSQKILWMTVKRLRYHPFARISFPNEQKMREYADMIRMRKPTIDNVIGFMDRLGLATEMTSKRIQQNAYYCGYDCDKMEQCISIWSRWQSIFLCNELSGEVVGWNTHSAFFSHIKERIGDYKLCVDQDSHGVAMQLKYLLAQFPKGAHVDCTPG